jgi:hypothetical protein
VSVQIRRQREFGRASDRSPPELGQVGGDVRSGSGTDQRCRSSANISAVECGPAVPSTAVPRLPPVGLGQRGQHVCCPPVELSGQCIQGTWPPGQDRIIDRGACTIPPAGGWSQRVTKPRRRSALSFDMLKLAHRLESAGSPRSKLAICQKAFAEAISSLATKDRLLHEVGMAGSAMGILMWLVGSMSRSPHNRWRAAAR